MRGLSKRIEQLEQTGSSLRLPALWVVPRDDETEKQAVARSREEQGLHDPEQFQIIWRKANAA